MAKAPRKSKRKYGSAADRARAGAAVAGPGGGGGTMFQNLGDVEFFNPEVPQNRTSVKYRLQLIPYVVSDENHPDGDIAPASDIWYKRPFKRYRGIGAEKKPYISPLSIGKSDPIFEWYKEARLDPDIPDKDANKARPQDMVMYNVRTCDMKTGEPNSDIMFWFISYHNFEKQLKTELLDPDNEEFAAFMDLEGGFDLIVRFQQETFDNNKFLKADMIQFVERDDIDESILDEVIDLDNVLVVKSYDELYNIFHEIDGAPVTTNDDEEIEEKPAQRKRRTAKSEPEDTGSDDDLYPDDLEEPEPKQKKRSVKPRPAAKGKSKDRCPHGFTFGSEEDVNEHDECDDCSIVDECYDAYLESQS